MIEREITPVLVGLFRGLGRIAPTRWSKSAGVEKLPGQKPVDHGFAPAAK